jgi:hypothetical protein
MWTNPGSLAAFGWLDDRGVARPSSRWSIEIALDVIDRPTAGEFDARGASRFHLDIYSEEWGYFFCHAGRASWIRTTDVAFVHVRDDYALLAHTPPLAQIGELVRALEREHGLALRRDRARVSTDLGAEALVATRRWLATL